MARTFGKRGGFGNIAADAKAEVIKAARRSVVEVLNGLADASPNWTGRFRDSWYVTSSIGSAVKAGGDDGNYNLFNVPGLAAVRSKSGEFAKAGFTGNSVKFSIGNSAPYADQAMDLVPYVPPRKGETISRPDPENVVAQGFRGTYRGEIEEDRDGTNRSTAELDWFRAYMDGGKFKQDFRRGVQLGFSGRTER